MGFDSKHVGLYRGVSVIFAWLGAAFASCGGGDCAVSERDGGSDASETDAPIADGAFGVCPPTEPPNGGACAVFPVCDYGARSCACLSHNGMARTWQCTGGCPKEQPMPQSSCAGFGHSLICPYFMTMIVCICNSEDH